MTHAQIFSEMLRIRGFWNSNFLFYFANGKWRLEQITFQTFRISLSFFDAEDCPVRLVSSTEVWLSLKRFYLSWVFVLLMASSPNACFNISKVSENAFPNLKQNFTQHVAHENHTLLIAEKSAKQAWHAFPLIDTMSKHTRTIRFVKFAQGNRGISLHLHVGALIQKFGNFTDWLHIKRVLLFMWHMVVNYIAWTTWFNGKLNHFVLALPYADLTCHTFCLLTDYMEQSPNTLSDGKETPDFLWKHDLIPGSQQVVIPCPVPNESSPHYPFLFSLSSI